MVLYILRVDLEEIGMEIGQMLDHHQQFLQTLGIMLHLQTQNLMEG